MSSKEKVLAIRPDAVCERGLIKVDPFCIFDCKYKFGYIIKNGNEILAEQIRSESSAWAAAYKYLTK